jgi:branched-chain amino acid transport system permease protein
MALAESRASRASRAAPQPNSQSTWLQNVNPAAVLVGVIIVIMPAIASSFVLTQIFGWSYMLGTIALSLMFLAGYGGMVSLAQMTIAGFAGYVVAILGVNGVPGGIGWPWWLAVPAALILSMVVGAAIGALAVRTVGIYTIMITLAIAAAFFYFANQNYAIFNGHTGINAIPTPVFLGVDWRDAIPSYYLELGVAFLCWLAVSYVARAPFGLALQGIRDNPRRMAALGFNVTAHRIAAYVFAAVIAALGGILLVWSYGEIAPGTVSVSAAIDILVIAVVGGIGNPIGAFIGALIYAVLKTFALDVLVAFGLDGNRFRLLIGLGFLAIVFFSPDGIIGLWARWRNRARRGSPRAQSSGGRHG